mgnify:CR=1 FL=1
MQTEIREYNSDNELEKIREKMREKIAGGYQQYGKKTFYHYTAPENLIKILKKETMELRFTKVDCLNDKSEGKEFKDIYKDVCEQLRKEEKIDQCFYEIIKNIEFKDIYLAHINNDRNILYADCDTYICCFSEGNDLLSMWNYYSKNSEYEGYNIGIEFNNIDDLEKCFFKLKDDAEINLYKVIYEKENAKQLISEFLLQIYEKANLQSSYSESAVIDEILLFSTMMKYIIKSKVFEHEKEVRFILYVRKDSSQYDIKFTTKKGIVVPYMNLKLEKKYIKKITMAPLLEQETAQKTLEFFLKQNGYKVRYDDTTDDGVLIKSSEVPIRY